MEMKNKIEALGNVAPNILNIMYKKIYQKKKKIKKKIYIYWLIYKMLIACGKVSRKTLPNYS